MATIKDVARVAKVSSATVSRVIHGKDLISTKTRNKVHKAIKELGYRPNSHARALKQQKSDLFGLVIPNISSPFIANMASSVEIAAKKQGFKVIIRNSLYDEASELDAIETLRDHGCRNIILHSYSMSDNQIIELAAEIPGMVLINRFIEEIAQRCVWLDNIAAGRTIGKFLLSMKHQKIAVITSDFVHTDAKHRLQGVQQALIENGVALPESNIFRNDVGGYEGAISSVDQLINSKHEFTAIVAFNDMMAVGVLNGLQDKGFSLPNDFSVIGFDDLFFSEMCRPSLTTMHYPISEMAQHATELSVLMTEKAECLSNRTHLFMASLVKRNSVVECKK